VQDEYSVFVDLIYGAPTFKAMFDGWSSENRIEGGADGDFSYVNKHPLDGRTVMYVHSGGLEGISSQLTRYKHDGLLDDRQLQ